MTVLYNQPLSKYSSFRTGGMADVILFPETKEELIKAMNEYPNAPVFGNLSNTLVKDGGIKGGIIITTKMNGIFVSDREITANTGATLSAVALAAKESSLTGCEFLYGIPGTVGGGVYMNAGAYGGEISQIITGAVVITKGGQEKILSPSELSLSYRHSALEESGDILVSATFGLKKGNAFEIAEKMTTLMDKRISSQPLDKPSCGSTFKRPTGYFAAKLIEDCGLKGKSVGDACVSPKHAGFVVNNGNATSADILSLISFIKKTVFEQTGVNLEEEIRIIGLD